MNLILAIDDDKSTLKILEAQIRNMGHQVIIAASGQEGIDLARTGNPDLILLDIVMPNMNGFGVIKNLRKDESTRGIPIIMLSSKSDKEYVVTAMKQGAIDYIVKPHDLSILTQKIQTALRVGKLHRIEEAAERTEHINISREPGRTVISFKTGLKGKTVLAEARMVFNPVFFKLLRNDRIAFDLHSLDEIDDEDIKIIKMITDLFAPQEVNIVAGRHYGVIVSSVDLEERVKLHLSFGDLELYLSRK